ncbi:uncharacterized protein LY79DRAFT_72457 [Colletotrichum navitas]|uniref:Uncharacterized protein n=1 Tax=Colletotrichum navitas TaxID=681940 RepID=A0AAD8UWJ8_9PEZI|nr:uncharacterized protein LY79DRAFT_72457 [Colletotrichum navitas]KAK1569580.1 hypothetical protein LY79DRAFT_72457 [Colletotrichum navitas]
MWKWDRVDKRKGRCSWKPGGVDERKEMARRGERKGRENGWMDARAAAGSVVVWVELRRRQEERNVDGKGNCAAEEKVSRQGKVLRGEARREQMTPMQQTKCGKGKAGMHGKERWGRKRQLQRQAIAIVGRDISFRQRERTERKGRAEQSRSSSVDGGGGSTGPAQVPGALRK